MSLSVVGCSRHMTRFWKKSVGRCLERMDERVLQFDREEDNHLHSVSDEISVELVGRVAGRVFMDGEI